MVLIISVLSHTGAFTFTLKISFEQLPGCIVGQYNYNNK